MGRQTAVHMLAQDCEKFLGFVQQRDPVVVTRWNAETPEIEEVRSPCKQGGFYCLWNQSLLPSLKRNFIPEAKRGPYYRIDSSLAVVEFSYPNPVPEPWNARPAHFQGRVWAGFECEDREFERWYNAIVRWIRKSFVKNPIPHLGGYVGPAAYDWYKKGGLLLPQFAPPITTQWLSWVEAQDQHRSVFSK